MTRKKIFLLLPFLGIITTAVVGLFWQKMSLSSSSRNLQKVQKVAEVLNGKSSQTPGLVQNQNKQESNIKMPLPTIMPYRPYYNPPYTPPLSDALEVDQRVYEKTATFSLLVNNISKYVNALSDYFLTIKGRILSSQINSEGDYAHAYIQVKVPVDKFDEANLRIRNEAKEVMGQNVNSLDRTGNLVTSQTKLDELEEKRLEKEQALLVAKTENEKKRLELEIKNLNSQIKKAENEVKNVETKTDYATITLTIADNKRFFKPVNEETPDLTIVFEDAIRTVLKIIVWAVAVAIQIVVFSLLWLPLVFLIKKLLFTKKTSP